MTKFYTRKVPAICLCRMFGKYSRHHHTHYKELDRN